MTVSPTRRDAPKRIPDEIVEAIKDLRAMAYLHGLATGDGTGTEDEDRRRTDRIQSALDSTILRHLSAALVRAERVERALRPFAEADHPTQAWDEHGLRDLQPSERVNIRVGLGEILAARAALSDTPDHSEER